MPNTNPELKRKYQREYYRRRLATDAEFKKKHYERVRSVSRKARQQIKDLIAEFKASGCSLCPESEPCCLSAHHLESDAKDFNVGDAVRTKRGLAAVANELKKCICVCENCHRKIHAGVISLA